MIYDNSVCMRYFMLTAFATAILHARSQTSAVQVPTQVATAQATTARIAPLPKSRSILPEGTAIRMRINQAVSSANAHVGETIEFKTLDAVRLGNVIVISKGTKAIGQISEAVLQRKMMSGSRLEINIEYVRLRSGGTLVVRGNLSFVFLTGKDITVRKGHEVTVQTNFD